MCRRAGWAIPLLAAAVPLALPSGPAAADTPTTAILSCNIPRLQEEIVSPSVTATGPFVVEGALATSGTSATPASASVPSGGTLNLVADSADVPGSAFGSAVTLLDPPDTGLGAVIQLDPAFASWLSSISGGSDITMSSASPIGLTVTGGTSTPPATLSLSGTFAMPPAPPANTLAVVLAGTAGGSIVAGSSGTVSVGVPAFTAADPLVLTVSVPSFHTTKSIDCLDGGGELIDTATVSPPPTTTTTASTTTTVSPTTTTTVPPTTTTTTTPVVTKSSPVSPPAPPAPSLTASTRPQLAFTGAGSGLWMLALAGVVLLGAGAILLLWPGRLFVVARRRGRRVRRGS
ncbi:MAG: hypothetical protein ACYCU7_03310 [Acidimicrobiales bacterium]